MPKEIIPYNNNTVEIDLFDPKERRPRRSLNQRHGKTLDSSKRNQRLKALNSIPDGKYGSLRKQPIDWRTRQTDWELREFTGKVQRAKDRVNSIETQEADLLADDPNESFLISYEPADLPITAHRQNGLSPTPKIKCDPSWMNPETRFRSMIFAAANTPEIAEIFIEAQSNGKPHGIELITNESTVTEDYSPESQP